MHMLCSCTCVAWRKGISSPHFRCLLPFSALTMPKGGYSICIPTCVFMQPHQWTWYNGRPSLLLSLVAYFPFIRSGQTNLVLGDAPCVDWSFYSPYQNEVSPHASTTHSFCSLPSNRHLHTPRGKYKKLAVIKSIHLVMPLQPFKVAAVYNLRTDG